MATKTARQKALDAKKKIADLRNKANSKGRNNTLKGLKLRRASFQKILKTKGISASKRAFNQKLLKKTNLMIKNFKPSKGGNKKPVLKTITKNKVIARIKKLQKAARGAKNKKLKAAITKRITTAKNKLKNTKWVGRKDGGSSTST